MDSANGGWITVPQFIRQHQGLVAKNFVYDAIKAGRLPAIRLSSKKILVRADSFDLLFDQSLSPS